MAENNVILQVQDVTMQFGGLRAIDNVSFHVDEAEILALSALTARAKQPCLTSLPPTINPPAAASPAGTSLKGLKPNRW